MSALRIAVLLSVGQHPLSGRSRRAPEDARALEMALGLKPAEIEAIHAGDPADRALRDYLGMGLRSITVLETSAKSDPAFALAERLRIRVPDLLLTGLRAESSEGSGFIPYLIAERLKFPIVHNICSLAVDQGSAKLVQALPNGQRRAVRCPLPLVATVGAAAPNPRQSAFARAKSGRLKVLHISDLRDDASDAWTEIPARPRPKRMPDLSHLSGPQRLEAMTRLQSRAGRILTGLPPDQAAAAIYDYLESEHLIGANPSNGKQEKVK